MACPRCGNTLAEQLVGSHTLRGCETCGGMFLEPAAVETLERTRDEAILRAAARFMPIRLPVPPSLRLLLSCPFCQIPLVRLELGETGHAMDICSSHGTFFERGELLAFADLCQQRRAGDVSAEDLAKAGILGGLGWWKKS